ncbi:pentatricopeptide repeat-containing protein At1g71420 [Cynara cardunculus var. scolymus]|uniref:pentatricopeptide repeat-containing protein At1g71420 n=1 Tax=Cynara cardunculus var. scolymus TaxID=59895 RepID=UPI000D627D67|nr:pentatricopeptide repeat-containing protein At1g71420 [Cynara cardunculus var. scolymus]
MFNLRHLRFSPAFTSSASAYLNFHENLSLCLTKGHLDEALTLFYTSNFSHTQQTYADLLHACARHGCLSQGQALHHHMLNTHNRNGLQNLYVTNHLINMYAKCGCLEYARKVFDEMGERNIVSWTALISGYSQFDRREESCGMFSEMLADCRPNEFAYASVLSCCDCEFGKQVHGHSLKTCFDAYTYVANALITMYSKNDDKSVCKDEPLEAWMVFKFLKFRNLVTWNSMIAAFQTRGKWEEAVNLFLTMRHDCNISFDRATLLSVFSSLLMVRDDGDDAIAECLKFCSQVHCLAIKTWFISEIEVITTLIKAYADLGVEIPDLYSLFLETRGRRDIVSWTAFITIFAERVPEESLRFFSELCQEGLIPDRHTYSIVLKACAGLVTNRPTLAIHSQILKHGFENDTVLANTLIHAYGRSGSLIESVKVFDTILNKDIVSWNSMIKIYGLHGQPRNALKCFAEMNVAPDATTFVALLSACSHAGLVEEGTKVFETMSKTYGIVHQIDHYACMVDILGRSGRILDAQKLINEMPMEPDSVIWSSMLAACRKHGETDLAELAATKLQDLDPKNSLGYVLMSNIHCLAGTFDESVDIRNQMEGFGVKKNRGLSWTEIGTRVHEFAAGGVHHPQREVIFTDLEELVKELKGLGYVPETNLAMRDVEEEDKNRELSHHSEKLAFVFALKHHESNPFSAIRIVKNIRICVDCHNFMKFASELVGREIIVRDSNRFHHFKERVCSCNDYW